MTVERAAIVIPAWNEAATIGRVVGEARLHGRVIVVDDGSGDRTAQAAAGAGAQVVRHETNQGYDRALVSGLAACLEMNAAMAVTIDADGQHDARVLGEAIARLGRGADLVIGCRDVLGRWSEHVFNAYSRVRYGVPDILCGLKGYRMDLVRKAGPEAMLGSVGTGLALWGLRGGCRAETVMVPVRPRSGTARFGAGFRANARILKAMGKELADTLLDVGR